MRDASLPSSFSTVFLCHSVFFYVAASSLHFSPLLPPPHIFFLSLSISPLFPLFSSPPHFLFPHFLSFFIHFPSLYLLALL
uniref:Uncharacterized protein n=1 Tax=Myripristis murdjan TaxID=586833 RepID=A0A667Y1Q6_9TELE